jgi:DNA helicase II / ATP-dependent DNA helicase PcrA
VSAAEKLAPAERVWSPMQSAIFAAIENPAGGNLVIEALAGTGKSTTLEECVKRTTEGESVLVCAFNKPIADALRPRMPKDVTVSTIHGFGFKVLGASAPARLEVGNYLQDMAKEVIGRGWDSREARTAVVKLCSAAKGQLYTADQGADALDAIADALQIQFPRRGWDRRRLVNVARQMLRVAQQRGGRVVDFDDMIWLPVVRGLEIPRFNWVFVDETQDLNPAQLALVKAAGDGGRIVAVGDRRQSIYGFRGADPEAIPRMIDELAAETLPLSITYRCPQRVVREANSLVPELQAAPGAPDGIVRNATEEALLRDAAPGDMVLSRTNAPLISLAFRWIALGRRAMIQGRDIGAGLAAWIEASGCGTGFGSILRLQRAVEEWRREEMARLEELERDTQAVEDRAACLLALCEGRTDVADVLQRIAALFGDANPEGAILLSSTHRAKGLEAPRVWLLRDTYCVRPGLEEENLLYVAITRSKGELIYVTAGDVPGTDSETSEEEREQE